MFAGSELNGGWGNLKFWPGKTVLDTINVTIKKFSKENILLEGRADVQKMINLRNGQITAGNPFRTNGWITTSFLLLQIAFKEDVWFLMSKWNYMRKMGLLGSSDDDSDSDEDMGSEAYVRYVCLVDHVVAGKGVKEGPKINSPLRTSLVPNVVINRMLEVPVHDPTMVW